MTKEMINLGYDPISQQTIVGHGIERFAIENSVRGIDIVACLVAVGTSLDGETSMNDGKHVIYTSGFWMYTVPYSDKAWADLLSVKS